MVSTENNDLQSSLKANNASALTSTGYFTYWKKRNKLAYVTAN